MLRFLAAYASYVWFLHNVDGPWRHWSRGGMLDGWTATHVAWGAIANRMDVSLSSFMLLGLGNEAIEAWSRQNRPDLLWGEPESLSNVAADIVANFVGWKISDALS